MSLPVGPMHAVAADSGFAAGPAVAGTVTTAGFPLQDLASAEATDEAPPGPRATPTVRPLIPVKAQRLRRPGALGCYRAGQSRC